MPRTSAEAQLMAAFRPQPQPLAAPKSLHPARARTIWRQLVEAKPADYFLTTDVPLLSRFCTLAARAEEIEEVLASVPVQSTEAPRLERRLTAIASMMTNLAVKLRLTVASRVERHAAIRSAEAKDFLKPWEERLLGGHTTKVTRQ